MNNKDIIKRAEEFAQLCNTFMVGSIDKKGYPNIKAMLKIESDGINNFIFSTSNSSKRTEQFRNNSKSCLYMVDDKNYIGLMLIGTIEILDDEISKKKYWHDWMKTYYPDGAETSYYCLYRFKTEVGQYYYRRPYDFTLLEI